MFVIAYETPSKTYLVVDSNDEDELLKLAKKLEVPVVLPAREIKKLGKVVYEQGYKKIIDP